MEIFSKAVTFSLSADRTKYDCHVANSQLDIKKRVGSHSIPETLRVYLESNVIRLGPKIFRPSHTDCEALENVEMNFPWKSYQQPFSTMIVEYPEDYSQKRIVPCVETGTAHEPDLAIVYYNPKIRLMIAGGYLTSNQNYSGIFWDKENGQTVEDAFAETFGSAEFSNVHDEQVIVYRAIRAAINACQLLSMFRTKEIGPDNPSYYSRCERYVEKAKTRGQEELRKAQRDLRLIPFVYSFQQKVTLYEDRRKKTSEGRSAAIKLRPHWRRGHYRNQAFGSGKKEKRMIFIAPVLVNEDFFTDISLKRRRNTK